jgi:phosphohistidine swiveling domain-containing protein
VPITIEYPCADGTLLPVTFDTEEHAARRYKREVEHMPEALPPLAAALERMGSEGGRRAYEEVGLFLPPFFEPGPDACGFAYFYDGDFDAEMMAKMMEGLGRLVAEHGSALGIWHGLCLPRTQQACADLEGAGPSVPMAELAGLQAYGLQMTMIPAYVCGNDLRQLTDTCRDIVGDGAELVASELTQGFENETLRADRELWLVGREVRKSSSFMAALSSERPAEAMADLRRRGEEPEAFAAVDRYLADFGRRAEGWDIAVPTWDEQADGFWCQLRQVASDQVPDPAATLAEAARRREELFADLDGRAAHDRERQARFRRRVERVAPYVAVREERAFWQLRTYGSLRHAVLRRGALFVERGLLDRPDDVLYLLPAEVDSSAADADLRAVVAQRRAEHERWKQVTPPEYVGGDPVSAEPKEAAPGEGALKGVGASRGTVTGTARVITDLCDADRLEVGDVLVCAMTSPPWTPLFGVAAAVVVDSGDLQSHPGIAAREYGIPCVLGTGNATASIPDGATVRVDGERGVVEVLGR